VKVFSMEDETGTVELMRNTTLSLRFLASSRKVSRSKVGDTAIEREKLPTMRTRHFLGSSAREVMGLSGSEAETAA